jgi:hypothetical protein
MVVRVNAKAILWENLSLLMTERWGRTNLRRLADEAEISEASVYRLKPDYDGFPGLDMIEAVAAVFGREPWQLLLPRFSDGEAAAAATSELAAEVTRLLDQLEPERRRQAYALIVQLLHFSDH